MQKKYDISRETPYHHLVSGGSLVMLINHTMAGSYFTYVIQKKYAIVNMSYNPD